VACQNPTGNGLHRELPRQLRDECLNRGNLRQPESSSSSGESSVIASLHRTEKISPPRAVRLSRSRDRITPAVLRIITQHAPRFLNRQECLVWTELLLERHVRENLGQQLRCRPRHNRVGISDDEGVRALEWGFKRPSDCLSSVASVDIAPKGYWSPSVCSSSSCLL
jgi:hypothetical protein